MTRKIALAEPLSTHSGMKNRKWKTRSRGAVHSALASAARMAIDFGTNSPIRICRKLTSR